MLNDCKRVVHLCYPAISSSAGHVYISALPPSPSASVLRATYCADLAGTPHIHIGQLSRWNANTLAMEGHTDGVLSVAYSPDGERIVSGSGDRTIRLWHRRTGAQLHVLTYEGKV